MEPGRDPLKPWCTGGAPACPAAESARKDPRPEGKGFVFRKKTILYISNMYTRPVLKGQRTDSNGSGTESKNNPAPILKQAQPASNQTDRLSALSTYSMNFDNTARSACNCARMFGIYGSTHTHHPGPCPESNLILPNP